MIAFFRILCIYVYIYAFILLSCCNVHIGQFFLNYQCKLAKNVKNTPRENVHVYSFLSFKSTSCKPAASASNVSNASLYYILVCKDIQICKGLIYCYCGANNGLTFMDTAWNQMKQVIRGAREKSASPVWKAATDINSSNIMNMKKYTFYLGGHCMESITSITQEAAENTTGDTCLGQFITQSSTCISIIIYYAFLIIVSHVIFL